jgi:hypothetical protein
MLKYKICLLLYFFTLMVCSAQSKKDTTSYRRIKLAKPSLFTHKIKVPGYLGTLSNFCNGFDYYFMAKPDEFGDGYEFLPEYLPALEYSIGYKHTVAGVGFMHFIVYDEYNSANISYFYLKLGYERNINRFIFNGNFIFTKSPNSYVFSYDDSNFYSVKEYHIGLDVNIGYKIVKGLFAELSNVYMPPQSFFDDVVTINGISTFSYFQSVVKLGYSF